MSSSHLPEPFATLFDSASSNIGIAADQIRLLVCLLLSIPLGFIFNHFIYYKHGKHLFSCTVGLLLAYTVVGTDIIHLFILSTFVYTLLHIISTSHVSIIVFILSMSYLSAIHIYRLYTDFLGYKLEVSMLLMIAVPKLHMLSCNITDGYMLNKNQHLHKKPHIQEFRKKYALYSIPGIIEYYSYILFFPTVLVGPVIPARLYFDYCESHIIPNDKLYGLIIALRNAIFTGIMFLVHQSYIPASGYIDSKQFLYHTSFLYRLFYINIMGPFCRAKYYLVWYLSQAGCIAAGYGKQTDKSTNTITWNGSCNAKILLVELAPSFNQVSTYWNIGVSDWLKNYVYLRTTAPKFITRYIAERTFNNFVTKATSAFYHGFYLSYYLFFLSMAIVTSASEIFYTAFEHYFVVKKKDSALYIESTPVHEPHHGTQRIKYYIWRVICWVVIYSPLNILGMAFILLATPPALELWSSMYYYGHTMSIFVLIVSYAWIMTHKQKHKSVQSNGTIKQIGNHKEL